MTAAALQLAETIRDLNACWTPHQGQQPVLYALFGRNEPVVFNESGRKKGKSEGIAYFLWRRALTTKPLGHYYFAPEQKQAKEIFWAANRIQTFGPQKYIEDVNNTEMRIRFRNGAFIKVDGSDNYNAYRGVSEVGSAVYDEFRDFRPEFHQAFGPNAAVNEAPLLICSTPPEAPEGDEAAEHYDAMKVGLERGRNYFNFPSWVNPHLSRAWLLRERAKLYARGEGDVWEREYAARRVHGGKKSIFPMFQLPTKDAKHTRHVWPHDRIMAEVRRDRKKLIWQIGADPGTVTCFAVLFRAINPYSRRVYVLDEIYEKDQSQTSTSLIIPRIRALRDELYPDWEAHEVEWEQIYDEAEAWFAQESLNSFGEAWAPTRKAEKPKTEGLSLLKDQMLGDLIIFSDRCVNAVKEIGGYIKDKNGNIPKKNDHTIDVNRYLNSFGVLDLTKVDEPAAPDPDDARRGYTIEEDLEADSIDDDYGLDDF